MPGAADAIATLRDLDGPTLVVTSRERLQLAGEHVYPVPQLSPVEGLGLFTARAAAIEPSFAPDAAVEELCGRLDNLPLAIELAAARTAVLQPEQILERLGDRLDLLKGTRDADPASRLCGNDRVVRHRDLLERGGARALLPLQRVRGQRHSRSNRGRL